MRNWVFWQIELEEKFQKYKTFITPFGRFKSCKMPFGISAAPEFFWRQITKLLDELNEVACMMDDILVYEKNQYKHEKKLEEVMKRLEKARMTLHRSRCVFSNNEVTFLGHRVSDKGVRLLATISG